ncbi:hypothetical protein AVEN_269671-1 [Araneus ventricosus]|uniref:Uncharacterized protein n=1 Tax=Araneus ventricosus TaxID=182803 RepID=A0A4Y2RTS9_ARAVE|nr:hypothetical protein AVEN_269671-1 [Araneus ventricosus]
MTPKSPKNRFTVLPWMNSEQLNKVYNSLYSESISQKRWAVDQISVWNTRCYPSLPTAVELTESIVRATIHDTLYQVDKTFCQEEDIKMLYCIALISVFLSDWFIFNVCLVSVTIMALLSVSPFVK